MYRFLHVASRITGTVRSQTLEHAFAIQSDRVKLTLWKTINDEKEHGKTRGTPSLN